VSHMDYKSDNKLLEMLDELLLEIEPRSKAIIEHLFVNHWNEAINGKQEAVFMALGSWLSEYGNARRQDFPVEVAMQAALGKVMQVPMVQQMISELMKADFERKWS